MKHGVIVLVSIFVLAFSPAVAPAQGVLGGGFPTMPSMPSFGGFFGGGGPCDDPCPGPFNLFGTVAWNYQTIDLDLGTRGGGIFDLGAMKHTYRFNGVQLGLGAQAVSRTGFGAIVTFDILITGSSKDTENYNEAMQGPIFFAGSRHWNTKNDTYCFDGMGFYNVYSTAALVGGFRWNHLETTFNNPSGVIGVAGLPGDEAVLVSNIYQPYVGVMVDQGGPSKVLRIGMIGWPQLYGSVKYEQTVGGALPAAARIGGLTAEVSEGYFWEIFGEYGLREKAYMGAALSVFGKWTQYHIKGNFNLDWDAVGFGNLGGDDWGISMHRNSWVAGVKLDIPLALPVPFSF
ncbi:MAG: hypothetical protein RDU20_13735 [Desulfomonilaceae bacterium]|nr:hypothetical protein [Desulfomonilaceae bacterium]